MRDIKFRCWFDNKMFRVVDIDFAYKKINLSGADIIDFNEGVLMQYTGLKDKNGKEIYEGDIVKVEIYSHWRQQTIVSEIVPVEFKNEMFGVMFGRDENLTAFCHFHNTTFEVIGNIWENSDLLKEENK